MKFKYLIKHAVRVGTGHVGQHASLQAGRLMRAASRGRSTAFPLLDYQIYGHLALQTADVAVTEVVT